MVILIKSAILFHSLPEFLAHEKWFFCLQPAHVHTGAPRPYIPLKSIITLVSSFPRQHTPCQTTGPSTYSLCLSVYLAPHNNMILPVPTGLGVYGGGGGTPGAMTLANGTRPALL